MGKTIYFDMDGTLYDLYGCAHWLEKLETENVEVYREGAPLHNLAALARKLNSMRRNGFNIGVISWTSKNGSEKFNREVEEVKREWLARHLPSVQFNEIHIVDYGVSKKEVARDKNGWLIDDDERVLKDWGTLSFAPNRLIEQLKIVEELESEVK